MQILNNESEMNSLSIKKSRIIIIFDILYFIKR
jgi:hypothetical protein